MPNPNIPNMAQVFLQSGQVAASVQNAQTARLAQKQRAEDAKQARADQTERLARQAAVIQNRQQQWEQEFQLRQEQFEEQKKVNDNMQAARDQTLAAREKDLQHKESYYAIQRDMLALREEAATMKAAGADADTQRKNLALQSDLDKVLQQSVARRPDGPFPGLDSNEALMRAREASQRQIAQMTAGGMIDAPALRDAQAQVSAYDQEIQARSALMRERMPAGPATELDKHVTAQAQAATGAAGGPVDVRVKAAQDVARFMPAEGATFEPNDEFLQFFQAQQKALPPAQLNAYMNTAATILMGPDGPRQMREWLRSRLSQ